MLVAPAGDGGGSGGGGIGIVFTRTAAAQAAASSPAGTALSAASNGIGSPQVTITDCVFTLCSAAACGAVRSSGGALLIARTDTAPVLAVLNLTRVAVLASAAAGHGGGIMLRSVLASANGVTVANCTAAGGDGGGLFTQDASLVAASTAIGGFTLAHNTAVKGNGGGAALSSCILGGLQLLGEEQVLLAPSATPSPTATATRTASSTATASRSQVLSPSRLPTPSIPASSSASATPTRPASPSAPAQPLPGLAIPADSDASRWIGSGITVLNNSAGVSGGGLALVSCDSVIGGAVVLGNSAVEGGGVYSTGSGSLHMCAVLVAANRAAAPGSPSRGSTAGPAVASPAFGGGLAVLDATRGAHVCDDDACGRYLLLSGARDLVTAAGAPPATARLPFSALLSALVARSRAALAVFGGPQSVPAPASLQLLPWSSAGLRGVVPPAPATGDLTALWSGLTAAAFTVSAASALSLNVSSSGAAAAQLSAGAGKDAYCAWAGNAADGSGGDVAFRSASAATAVAAAGRPAVSLAQSLMYASSAGVAGGAVYVGSVPAALFGLDLIAHSAGDAYVGSAASCTPLAAAANTSAASAAQACSATGSTADAVAASFGGAIALNEPPFAALVRIRAAYPFARFGGALWLQPMPAPKASSVSGSGNATGQVAAGSEGSVRTAAELPQLAPRLLLDADVAAMVQSPSDSSGSSSASGGASSGASGDIAPPVLDGRIVLVGNELSNVSASAGGAGLFVHGAVFSSNGDAAAAGCDPGPGGCVQSLTNAVGEVLPLLPPPRPASNATTSSAGTMMQPPVLAGRSAQRPASSLPIRLHVASTLPLSAAGSSGSPAVSLVSLATAQGPVAVLHLRDAFNATTSWDDTTVCTVVVRAADGSSLSLVYPPRYQASAGAVSLAPFGIAAAPGASGTLQVSCDVALGVTEYTLRRDIVAVETARVRLMLTAVAAPPPSDIANSASQAAPNASTPATAAASAGQAASTAPFCKDMYDGQNATSINPNALVRPSPGTLIALPVLLPTVSGARPWQPDWHLRLSLVDATETAVVPPASLPCSVAVGAAVDAVTGSPISSNLLAYPGVSATAVELAGLSADLPIAIAGAAGAIVNVTASCRWVSGEAVSALAPLTVHTAALQLGRVMGVLAAPAPSQASAQQQQLQQPTTDLEVECAAYSLRCGRQPSACPLNFHGLHAETSSSLVPMPARSLASWSASVSWRLNISAGAVDEATGLASLDDELRRLSLPGLIGFVADKPNLALWGRGVLVVAPLPMSAPAVRALGLSNELTTPLSNESAWAATIAATRVAGIAPAALPSSSDGTQLLPLVPAPTLVLLARHASFPTPLAFMAGSGVCAASLAASGVPGSASLPSQAAVVGTSTAAITDGLASLSSVGLTGLPFAETSARLRVQCSLSGNEAQLAATLPLRIPAIRSTLVSTIPALLPPSSPAAIAQLRSPLTYAFTVEAAGGNASAPSRVSDANTTQRILADASLASELRAVGAKLVCTLQCSASGTPSAQAEPCALEGRTVAPMEASATGAVAAATATLASFGFSTLASYPNRTCVSTQCTWLDGQKLITQPVCVAQPAAAVAWCDTNESSLAAACNATEAASGSSFPSVAAPNEPLQPFVVAVFTAPAEGLTELGLESAGAASALRCSVEAVASAVVPNGTGSSSSSSVTPLGSMPVRGGSEAVADARTGLAVFRGAALALSVAQAAMLQQVGALVAAVKISCTLNDRPFGVSSTRRVRIPRLKATWVVRPPAVIAPATATLARPFSPPVTLSLADAADPAFVVDVAATCSLEIAARWLPPDAVAEGAGLGALTLDSSSAQAGTTSFVLLTGGTQRPLVRGFVSFPDVGLAGSMGASVLLRAACRRDEGGEVAVSEWNVSIAHAAVSWSAADAPPRLILSGRPFTSAFSVSWRVILPAVAAARAWQWRYEGSSDIGATALEPLGQSLPTALAADAATTRVQCIMALADVSAAVAGAQNDFIQFTPAASPSNETAGSDDRGQPHKLSVLLDVSGAAGRVARFQPTCTVGGHMFRAAARLSTLAAVSIVPSQPLPGAWLASDGAAVTYITPPPQLALAAEDGSWPDTRGAVCSAGVLGAFGRGAGTSILPLRSAAVNASSGSATNSALNVSSLAAQWPPAMSPSLVNAPSSGYFNPPGASARLPVAIDTLAVRAAFGDWVLLRLSCSRANKDPTLPLDVPVRIARMSALWLQQPPAEAFPGGIFNVSVLLLDADVALSSFSGSAAYGGVNATSSMALSVDSALANRAADAFVNDDVSSCTLVPLSVTDSAGRSLDVGKVVVQGGSAIARRGVLSLPAAAVTARVGTIVRGRVECSTGSLAATEATLEWRIAMTPCPRGSAPIGDGANCVNCGRQYSDGGPGATQCTTCPTVGANCAGGVLTLLPGFFRADANPTIDENTELHPCGLPFACWVNTTTTNRSAGLTHGCNEGYLQGSPLCGVCAPGYARTGKECGRCPPTAFNWFVTSLLPAGVLGFGTWAAQRSINEASPFAPLTRIALGHMQLLGTLMGAFVAQATAVVREVLNFAEVAGSSPLAVAPVHCALGGISFYLRFMATLALAPVLMLATIGAQAALSCRKRWLTQRANRRAGTGLRSQAERHGAANQSSRLAGAKAFSLVPSFRGVLNPLASPSPSPNPSPNASSSASFESRVDSTLEQGASAPQAAASGSTVSRANAARPSKPCMALRRLADDPRIVGPAVFVLVSLQVSVAPW